jgi:sugar phosphate isomerase/epimerase
VVPAIKIGLSTASVWPQTATTAFELAAELGYDGVEVMVWNDPVSQDIGALQALSERHQMPVLAIHAPCLLVTQRVWSSDPWVRLTRAQEAAEKLEAPTVVIHPPFRWQREYARRFREELAKRGAETEVRFAVENMYPWRARGREFAAYAPHWDPTEAVFDHYTLDISHAAVARADVAALAERMGESLVHLHLGDGTGLARDEHLVPGRGTQPCGELLEGLAERGFAGPVVVEVSTRNSGGRAQREADLAESLAFARLHFAAPTPLEPGVSP